MALGVFQRATADQLWRLLRPADRHDRCTRDTVKDLEDRGLVRVETRLPDNRKLWVLTERGHKEAKALLPRNVRLAALRKPDLDADGEPVDGVGYSEHAAAVTSTAAVLTAAGFGTPLSWLTEAAHKLPYGYTQYADLVLHAPDAGVPVMLIEVDRVTEPACDLVDKLRRYRDWFALPAPGTDPNRLRAARLAGGPGVHTGRLWTRLYPATGREGCPPVAFVFTGKTTAQRENRMLRLEQAARPYTSGRPYPGGAAGIAAVDWHQAVPVVVAELEQLLARGADAAVWRRLGRPGHETLTQALDNPDGDRLYALQRAQARQREEERQAAEREAQRPFCARCGQPFTDARWQAVQGGPWADHADLCEACAVLAQAERVAGLQETTEEAAQEPARRRGRLGLTRQPQRP